MCQEWLHRRQGYLSVTHEGDFFPGWHGGPTVSESYVPLVFSMPGNLYVDSSGNRVTQPQELEIGFSKGVTSVQSTNGNRMLRNWHLSPIVTEILTEFREN